MNRNNPHVRDIFHNPRKDLVPNNLQEVCVYNYSPGSRKKKTDFDGLSGEFHGENSKNLTDDENGNSKQDYNLGNNKNKNKKNKSAMHENRIPSDCKKNNANKNSNCGNYGRKTLTDKDIHHLERHLSMKKTIRKQISRNLAQAFVEDPNAVKSDILSNRSAATSQQQPDKSSNRSFTLTRAKVTKSEQNVLDMLRDTRDDQQSDFASPCNPSPNEEQHRFPRHDVVSSVKENISESKDNVVTGDRFSFWKMFSIWGRNKR